MNKRLVVLLLAMMVSLNVFAQSNQLNVKKGVPYCTAQFPGKSKMQKLCFDFYEP